MADSQLNELKRTLELMVAHAQTYGHALPLENVEAQMAIAALEALAKEALNELDDVLTLAGAGEEKEDHPLSPREYEVLRLAAKGLTNKEIAYRLGLSERTVQFHMRSVFNKTGTNSRTEAVALGLKVGWLGD